MIRRDRNHPSVLMWEPILNETPYPRDFALEALRITREEFPYPGRPVAAADVHSKGVAENYDVVYGWPGDDEKADRPEQCILLVSLARMWMTGMHIIIITVPAVAGGTPVAGAGVVIIKEL